MNLTSLFYPCGLVFLVNSKAHQSPRQLVSEKKMRFLVRLINTRRITTTKGRISFLASCTTKSNTLPTSHPQSESQWDHSGSDPKPPSISEFGPNSLTCRLERLPRKESVLVAFQGWMRDGFAVHRGLIFHAINRLRRRQMHSRALEVNFRFYKEILWSINFALAPSLLRISINICYIRWWNGWSKRSLTR